ncbi:cytochrome-c peroxidase [Brenneria goodwinii]|uniref:Cytochrome-c peroxidase n=1 Tax=Brenneria goodwinii TaxID=1109412 RepID=A0A0G4K0G9_9GAMM|nr:LacI family DNA-binding transcriptional regulator [Brenneria goodwinii]ATA23813.1 cytochrome-c peroxidase [Brenneria goodwinii]MCG8155751.1 LacI family DNA-binding transcriptional regulator [Brenneria goodwinii]MCG8160583.1 LacI family DNA-binding transcriptional regulator [Brenneria goodwinii]MCG8166315.1 LacI family DNA-binding transcriptional regulator [Brenneria goodwinii]MCG8171123.1 LacI family DNA-binding transcriptional regulator [Brenneria goodwinii]
MKRNLKIREIAAQTGLSISTVSRVLSGKANTSESAKKRILNCARQYGVLDDLVTGRLLLNSLMVFAPQRAFDVRSDIFYHKVLQSIIDALAPHEVRLRYCGLDENNSDVPLFMDKMGDPDTEASILIGIDDPYIHSLAADMGKPCVLINCIDRKMKLPSIAPDHRLIGEHSANYLFEQGHRDVLSLLCLRRYTMELRLAGIRDAYQNHNLPFADQYNLLAIRNFSTAESEQAVAEFLANCPSEKRPTAILAGGDFIAVGAVNALQRAGLHVPQDISVMSMDGFNLASIHDIPLTSVHVPREELGEEAVRQLQYLLMRPDAPTGSLLLNGKLVIRDSVRRIRPSKTHSPVQEDDLYD